ncbi:ead/Ea22-like family protein [Salmonella enterica]|nr:ead/Ea22-like family protein [Salmonella enterica]EAS6475975.1 ead/Ea22-like family protein [Salmonella enterica]EAY0413458.1 ead/Ea22-like family protein [Salmonella enterica]EAY0421386.1 ead/Ea22-like family protein [Salmonella enterica]EBA6752126.1 ead/Ea22-like family protein [Salmonella enterica]
MSNIDKQALREEFRLMQAHYSDPADRARQVIYIAAEALLDELDKKQQYIKLRDQENEDIALTVGKLRVELEAAKKRMTEQSAIVAAAEKLVRCKGRYHSELNYRALAKLFGVVTPDLPPLEHENVHYADAAEVEITALRQRIQELEARAVNLPKRSVDEVMHLSGFSRDYAEGWCAGNDNAIHEIRTAGIKVKGE